jgi:hypothetical protein
MPIAYDHGCRVDDREASTLKYFQRNASFMDYRAFLISVCHIASGVIEGRVLTSSGTACLGIKALAGTCRAPGIKSRDALASSDWDATG